MSVADLFATQTAFNQKGLYQDTPESNQAWKTAFDIANNFAGTAEKFRQHDENLATSAARVGALNAQNNKTISLAPWEVKSGIANAQKTIETTPGAIAALNVKNKMIVDTAEQQKQALLAQYGMQIAERNLKANQYEGQNELLKYYGEHGFDPNTGEWRTPEELRYLGQGFELSPYALGQIQNPQQKVNQSNQVDLRTKQTALDKVYQDALDTDENGIPVLNKEKFAAGIARVSAVYGADDTVVTDFSRRVAALNGWITQPATQPQENGTQGDTQSTVPVGGIPAPVAPEPQQNTQQQPLSKWQQEMKAKNEAKEKLATQTQVVASPATFTEPQTDSVYVKKWAEELDMSEETARKQLIGMIDMLNRGLVSPEEAMRGFNLRLQREKERKALMDKAAAIPTQQRVSDALIKSGYDPASLGIY